MTKIDEALAIYQRCRRLAPYSGLFAGEVQKSMTLAERNELQAERNGSLREFYALFVSLGRVLNAMEAGE